LGEIVASVSIAYNDVLAARSRSPAPQRAAVSLVFDLHHSSSHARGNVSRAVRAAVVRNHNFPRDMVPAKSLVYLLDTPSQGFNLVQAWDRNGQLECLSLA
jgi:hypothetical protein